MNSEKSVKYGLTARILIGMLLGVLVGVTIKTLLSDSLFVQTYFTEGLFNVLGQIFVTSLRMLVVPLVFVSLVCGTCSLSDPKTLGRLGGKTIALYLLTTAIAISLAISIALLISPGDEVHLTAAAQFDAKAAPSLGEVFINLFPSNPIQAMASGNMLQIIVFAVLFGIAMAISGKPGERLAALFQDLNSIVMNLVTILMNLAPYGVFALMAKLFATQDFETIGSLLGYFGTVFGVLLLHGLVTYPLMLKALSNLSPRIFLGKMRDAVLFAFSTSSSNATIPVSMETVTRKFGAKNSVASFTIPLGATINMDGTAIMQGVATVFIAQVYDIDLTIADYLMVILTATLASVGTAGVPGVGLIMLAMVLQQVNLPVEGIALIIGVDRLLDMTRTAVNVTGDCMVTCIVAKSEGALDQRVFNSSEAGLEEEEIHFSKHDT